MSPMPRSNSLVILAFFAALLCAFTSVVRANATPDELKAMERLAIHYMAGEIDAIRTSFSPELAASQSTEDMAKQRSALLEKGGALRHIRAAWSPRSPEGRTPPFLQAVVPVDLEKISMEILFTWPRAAGVGQLSGFAIRAATRRDPATAAGPRVDPPFSPADYVDARKIQREPLKLGPEAYPVDAEYVRPRSATPNSRVPAVIFLPDRDTLGIDGAIGPSRMWKDLADGLATAGVASIRYERRMARYYEKAFEPYRIDEELYIDLYAALRAAAARPEVDMGRVYLLGHGFGAWAAPAMHSRAPRVRGLILLSPPASYTARERLDTLVREDALPGANLSAIRGAVGYLEQRRLDPAYMVVDAPAQFWYSTMGLDPIPLLAKSKTPTLILIGGRDHRTSEIQRAPWIDLARARQGVAIRYLPNADYWLFPRDSQDSAADEALRHVDREAIDAIARFAASR